MNFLVWDCGLYCHQMSALAEDKKNQVRYFTPWLSKDPHFSDFIVGKGFENIEKVLYFEDHIDWADCIVYPDVAGNAQCNYLRKTLKDKSVYGAGLGERLENDRILLKKWCKEFGLPVSPYQVCQGITKLREYLKTNPKKYVKVNIFRGDLESFFAKDYESVELVLDQAAIALGPMKEDYTFIVEDLIETDVELGFDGFFNGIDYIKPYIFGYEISKGLYIGRVSDELPEPIEETLDAFAPLFAKMDYRGALSTEERIVSLKEHYFIDACMRLPNPLSALYPVMIKNWAEAIYKIGKKEEVELDIEHKYVGAFPLMSQNANDNYVNVNIDPKFRDKVRYQMVSGRKDGTNYAVKGWPIVAILVAGGETVDEVLDGLREAAEGVEVYDMDKDPINGIDVAKEVIKKGEKLGIEF